MFVKVAGKRITKYGVALLAIILIGLFLRVYHLGAESIGVDEGYSVWIAKLSLSQIVQSNAADVHPPFYYLVLHYWEMLFGDSEFVVRFLSALFGVLAIPTIYLVGRQLFDEEAGLVAALILALSSFNIQYSQETRMYSLMLLLTLLSMYFFVRFLRKGNLAISAGYVLTTTLLLYTHVYGLFVLIAQNICLVALLFLARGHASWLRKWIALQAIVLALFAAWIPFIISKVVPLQGGYWIPRPAISTFVQTFIVYAGTWGLLLIFLGLSALSFLGYRKVTGSMDWRDPLNALGTYKWDVQITNILTGLFLIVWVLTLNVIPFAISRFSTPIYYTRFTIAASVALYLLVAGGIRNINWRYAKLAVITVIIILSVAHLQPYYTTYAKGQAREAFSDLNTNVKSGDAVILFPGGFSYLMDYYNGSTGVDVKPFPSATDWRGSVAQANAKSMEDNIKELKSDVNGYDRVWFVNATGFGSHPLLMDTVKTLNETHEIRYSQSYLGYDVRLFEKRN